MYFDKEEFDDEMSLCGIDDGDNLIMAGLKIIEIAITFFVMLIICLKVGKKPSKYCMPFADAQRIKEKYGIFIN